MNGMFVPGMNAACAKSPLRTKTSRLKKADVPIVSPRVSVDSWPMLERTLQMPGDNRGANQGKSVTDDIRVVRWMRCRKARPGPLSGMPRAYRSTAPAPNSIQKFTI